MEVGKLFLKLRWRSKGPNGKSSLEKDGKTQYTIYQNLPNYSNVNGEKGRV